MRYLGLGLLITFLSACGIMKPMEKSESNLAYLNIGDSKHDVAEKLGPADRVRASRRLSSGAILELHEYDIFGKNQALADALLCPITLTISCWLVSKNWTSPYWLQFIDGKLDRWGRAGDWQPNLTTDITIHEN